jgi:predicted permease
VVTGLIFGVFPALHTTRSGLALALKEAGRGALTSRGGSRLRSTLVVAEVALAVTLLAGAGLMIRSFSRLAAVDPGFSVRPALTFTLTLPDARYLEPAKQAAFFDQLLPQLEALPGVQQAAAVSALPFNGNFVLTFEVGGRAQVPPAQRPAMQIRAATTKYFDVLGIPLKRGRLFTEDDRLGTTPVVLITESAARQFFANEDPIGRKITLGMGRGPGTPRAGGEIVGVVGDVKDAGLSEAAPPTLFLPYRQWPFQSMSVVLASAVPPSTLGEAARRAVYSVDANLPVSNARTLDEIVARSISQPRFYMTLLAIFAGVAVALAAIGIFGVLSYAVAQRTREIGIRMALGAYERTVILLVLRDALVMAVIGLALGVAVALPLTRTLIAKLLYDTPPNDPLTFVAVGAVLILIALAAAGVPARRATRVDPIVALRAE